MHHAVRVERSETRDHSGVAIPRPGATALALVASDLAALGCAVGIAAFIARLSSGPPLGFGPLHAAVLVCALLLAFGLSDLYPGAGVSPVDEMRTQVLVVTGLSVVVAVSVLIGHGPSLWFQAPVFAAWLVAVTLTTGFRLILRELFARADWWGVPAVVLGAGKTAAMIIDRLRKKPNLNIKVVACLDDDVGKYGTSLGDVRVEGPILEQALNQRSSGVDYAIVAMPGMAPEPLSTLVRRLGRTFSKVVVIPNAFGMTSVGVGTRDSGGVVSLYVRGHLSLRRNRIIKRVLDVLLMVPLGLVATPAVLVCAIGVVIFSPGNPFFAQEREGFGGKRIRVWKLRTMRTNADQIIARHLERYPEARAEWQTRFKLENDPRIIPVVGRLMRRLSLDELPQVFNILKGDLSFVGPRPFPYYHVETFTPEFRELRASVPPGLTGYWQVTARATADLAAQVELDTYYITNWSPWLDLYVLARTPWAVLFGDGAY